MPRVSIIIPVYNEAEYLGYCLDSVLKQNFQDYEVICVNDGSTDNSWEILQQYALKDKRIKAVTQENKGLSEARNTALKAAKGEFIAFVDSDDFIAPEFLTAMLNAQAETNADIIGCDFKKIYKETDGLKEVKKFHLKFYADALAVLLHKNNFIHFNVWNKLYRRKVIGNIRFIPDIYYEDWVLNCCVFEQAQGFAWVKEKLYAYRISNGSIMRSDFNEKKLHDYVTGIREVYAYFMANAPEKWEKVRNTRISRTVKMMMNSALRAKNKELCRSTSMYLKELYNQNLISYKGLSWHNKIKLFKFLRDF